SRRHERERVAVSTGRMMRRRRQRRAISRRQWRRQMLNWYLAKYEADERAILTELGCPIDDRAALVAILDGTQPAPWPTRTATRDRERAFEAFWALDRLNAVRRAVAANDAMAAARAAPVAGSSARDAPAHASGVARAPANAGVVGGAQAGAERGGHAASRERQTKANERDERIRRLLHLFAESDDLQHRYRTPAQYVQSEIDGLTLRTIQRHLKRLGYV